MKFQFDSKEALFVIGLGLSVVATFILYIGYKLLASETFAIIIGVAFLIYYLIIGSMVGVWATKKMDVRREEKYKFFRKIKK